MTLTINPDLQSLIPPLTPEEYRQLEANLLADGCHDPLVLWQEQHVLLDGHHRLQICEQHGLDYHLQEISLASLDEAKAWMIANQLGRRNLTPDQMSYYRGQQYNLKKQQGRRTDLTSHQNDGKLPKSTAQVLADQHHVGPATIERDGVYAAAVETLASVLGPDARQAFRDGNLPLTRQDVRLLASLVTMRPETATQVKEALQGAAPADALRTIVTATHCGICHRPLSDPASVSRGIGPVCAGHGNGTPSASGGGGVGTARHAPVLVLEPEAPEADATTAPATWPQTVSTGDYEWGTPLAVLEAVRAVLGAIDVDPASCATAQEHVQARTFYTREDDGLRQPWPGTVFLNPPYKMPEIARFIGKLCEELDAQRTTDAILLVNSSTETDWFQRAFARADAVCFPDGRMHFVSATRNGDHPCQGQALLYYGEEDERFCAVFAALGVSTLVLTVEALAARLVLAETPPAPVPQPEPAPSAEAEPVSLPLAVWLGVQKLQPCTNAAVAQALDKRPGATHRVLQSLVKQGKVAREGQTYRVVDAP